MIEPPWLEFARAEARRGVVEIPGAAHTPRILEYHDATTLDASQDEVPWCSAFVCFCLHGGAAMPEGGHYRSTRSARARSFLRWGQAIAPAPLGAIVVLQRGSGRQPGADVVNAPGHVGFLVDAPTPTEVLILSGNQSNAVNVRPYPIDRVLAYRWPTEDEFVLRAA